MFNSPLHNQPVQEVGGAQNGSLIEESRALAYINERFFSGTKPLTRGEFDRAVVRAMDFIGHASGGRSLLPRFFAENPPGMMLTPNNWSSYGRCVFTSDGTDRRRIEIRPDMVLYPIPFIAVLAHEATHFQDRLLVGGLGSGPSREAALHSPLFRFTADERAIVNELSVLDQLQDFSSAAPALAAYCINEIPHCKLWRGRDLARCRLGIAIATALEVVASDEEKAEPVFGEIRSVLSESLSAEGHFPIESQRLKEYCAQVLQLRQDDGVLSVNTDSDAHLALRQVAIACEDAELAARAYEKVELLHELPPRNIGIDSSSGYFQFQVFGFSSRF